MTGDVGAIGPIAVLRASGDLHMQSLRYVRIDQKSNAEKCVHGTKWIQRAERRRQGGLIERLHCTTNTAYHLHQRYGYFFEVARRETFIRREDSNVLTLGDLAYARKSYG